MRASTSLWSDAICLGSSLRREAISLRTAPVSAPIRKACRHLGAQVRSSSKRMTNIRRN
jgi:hypothetical protein